MSRDVFVSYPQPDKPSAEKVCRALEADGIACWIAPRNIPPGATWASAIVQGIQSCRAMLLLCSENSNNSRQMSRELQLADERRMPVIPVRLTNVALKGDYSYYLNNTQWLDLFPGDVDDHIPELLAAVRSAIDDAGPSSSDTSPRTAQLPASAPRPASASKRSRMPIYLAAGVILAVVLAAGARFITNKRSGGPEPLQKSTQAQPAQVTGRNLRFVNYKNPQGNIAGGFVQQTGRQWIEFVGPKPEKVLWTFIELNRDDSSVYLSDPSRGVTVQLDLYARKVIYSDANVRLVPLYEIAMETARP